MEDSKKEEVSKRGRKKMKVELGAEFSKIEGTINNIINSKRKN
jgi:hypothetical protein